MRAIFKDHLIILIPESDEERADVSGYVRSHAGDVFSLRTPNSALTLANLGPQADACREPIDIASNIANEAWRPIGNFAHTPFVLDGQPYASVESFWQGLKFPNDSDRRRIAPLFGGAAKYASSDIVPPDSFSYRGGAPIRTGSREHWALMTHACSAKFSQHDAAREALLSTNDRPLEHRMRHDSRTIPGIVMADIWMTIRLQIRAAAYARGGGATY